MATPEQNQEPHQEEPAVPVAPRAEDELRPSQTVMDEPAPSPKPESGIRRFFRSLVRWLLLLVLLFGLGVAATYFWLYQPLTEQHQKAQADLQQTRQLLEQTQKDLKTAQTDTQNLKGQVETAQAKLAGETNRANLQTVLTDVTTARLALANKDGASAQAALQAAKTHLGPLMPVIKEKDSARADAVSTRLDLVMNELNRDPRTAVSDLDVLTRNLQELSKVLGISQ